jgi:hypothetical protein
MQLKTNELGRKAATNKKIKKTKKTKKRRKYLNCYVQQYKCNAQLDGNTVCDYFLFET